MHIKNQVAMKYLFKMSFLGIDQAYIAMQNRKNSPSNIKYEKSASSCRIRYKKILNTHEDLKKKQIKTAIKSFQFVPEELLHIPFRALVEPLGKGAFLKLGSNLTSNIKTRDIINYINEEIDAPSKIIKEVSSFKSQAIASIVFHSHAFINHDLIHKEHDTLDYLFPLEKTTNEISNILSNSLPSKHWQEGDLDEYQFNPHPIKNLTIDAMTQLRRWKEDSFSQILHECKFLPKFLGVINENYNISDIEYPINIKKLSIYTISSLSNRNNVKNKIPVLYNLGLQSIGSILLLEKKYRVLFNSNYSASIIKKIENSIL